MAISIDRGNCWTGVSQPFQRTIKINKPTMPMAARVRQKKVMSIYNVPASVARRLPNAWHKDFSSSVKGKLFSAPATCDGP